VQHDNYVIYNQWNIADAIIIVTASYSECYNAIASLDDVLAPHILDWIYSEGFDEAIIPNNVPEAILNGVAKLESVSESDTMCNNNWKVVTMWLVGNHAYFSCSLCATFECYLTYNYYLIAL